MPLRGDEFRSGLCGTDGHRGDDELMAIIGHEIGAMCRAIRT